MIPLSPDFVPGPFDVICCARGKAANRHPGNLAFQKSVQNHLCRYCQARSKQDRSQIVSSIVKAVQKRSPSGGFVREEDGQWYRAKEKTAREKVGQSLRNLLHTKYRSSSQSKVKKRKDLYANATEAVNTFVDEDSMCRHIKEKLLSQIEGTTNEDELQGYFNDANIALLEVFKKKKTSLESLKVVPVTSKASESQPPPRMPLLCYPPVQSVQSTNQHLSSNDKDKNAADRAPLYCRPVQSLQSANQHFLDKNDEDKNATDRAPLFCYPVQSAQGTDQHLLDKNNEDKNNEDKNTMIVDTQSSSKNAPSSDQSIMMDVDFDPFEMNDGAVENDSVDSMLISLWCGAAA